MVIKGGFCPPCLTREKRKHFNFLGEHKSIAF
jgi:hypothetical protein